MSLMERGGGDYLKNKGIPENRTVELALFRFQLYDFLVCTVYVYSQEGGK
jgi:hypothetical protein